MKKNFFNAFLELVKNFYFKKFLVIKKNSDF